MTRATAIALLALALTSRTAAASEHLHPLLKSGKVAVRSVVLVPLKVDFRQVAVTGVESRNQEAEILSSHLSRAAVLLLRERGIEVAEDAFAALGTEDEGRYAISDLQSRYDRASVEMLRRPKDVGKGRYTLGDEVAVIASKINASAFLFVRAVGSSLSGAARAMSPFAALFRQQILYELAIVDAATGDVWFLAVNQIMTVFGAGKRAEPENQILMLMRRAIGKVPEAKPSPVPTAGRAAIIRRSPSETRGCVARGDRR
jgi:hypothetical protein